MATFETTITLTTTANALGIFLHYPDGRQPVPLPGVATGFADQLAPGVYVITAAGLGNVPGTVVEFEIATDVNSIKRRRTVGVKGTLRAWITFELDTEGKLS